MLSRQKSSTWSQQLLGLIVTGNPGLWCRKTNPQNAEVAKKTWTDGRKYTLTLVQPSGEQLSLIAGYVEEVGHQALQMHSSRPG